MELKDLIEDGVLESGDRVAVGVSGGADSMLLLCALLEKQKTIDFYLKVVHVNHHLREGESESDRKFVEQFCEKRNIEEETIDVDVKKIKTLEKKTLEEAARQARYEAIFSVMKKENLKKLFVAHHQNDQVETILMNIFRGAGIDGAAGIKNYGVIVRPFLNLSKSKILSICSEKNIKFVTDSTNFENNNTRNYIRNVVLPSIEKIYPNAVDSISEFGKRAKEIYEYIQKLVNKDLVQKLPDGVLVREIAFKNENFILREYFKLAFEMLGIYHDIEAKHYKLAAELINLPVNSSLDFPHKIIAKRVHNGVKFCKKTMKNSKFCEMEFILGEIKFPEFGKIATKIVPSEEVCFGDGNFYADYLKIPGDAVWRYRRTGDVFAKLGSGSKKLNDYFTDKKVDIDCRDNLVVLASKNQVLLVLGLDIGECIKVSSDSEQVVKISFVK